MAGPSSPKATNWGMILFQTAVWLTLLFVILFASAGNLNYWQGWVYLAAIALQMGLGLALFSRTPDLIQERMKPGPGTKGWDKLFMGFFIPLYLAIVLIGGLDAGRFHWTRPLPWALYSAGYVVFVLSSALIYWAMWVNRFFSSVVRIQTDRGQTVIHSGPYRFIRHPGYLAGIAWTFSNALILGSLRAMVPTATGAVLLIIRTHLEDRTLQRELPGYAEYTRRVRYRLLPGVW